MPRLCLGALRSGNEEVQPRVERAELFGDLRDELVAVLPVAAVVRDHRAAVHRPDLLDALRQATLAAAVHDRILGREEVVPGDGCRQVFDPAVLVEVAPQHEHEQHRDDGTDRERQPIGLALLPDARQAEDRRRPEADRDQRADGPEQRKDEGRGPARPLRFGQPDHAGAEGDERLDLLVPRVAQGLVGDVAALRVGDDRDPLAALIAHPLAGRAGRRSTARRAGSG